jgi:hypothetical protein
MIDKRRFEFAGREGIRWKHEGKKRTHRMRICILLWGTFVFFFAFLLNYFKDQPSFFTVLITFCVMMRPIYQTNHDFRKSLPFIIWSIVIAGVDVYGIWVGSVLSDKSGYGNHLKTEAAYLVCIFIGLFIIMKIVDLWRLRQKRNAGEG